MQKYVRLGLENFQRHRLPVTTTSLGSLLLCFDIFLCLFPPPLCPVRIPLASIQTPYPLFWSWAYEIPALWPWQKPVRDWVALTCPQSFIFKVIKLHCLSFSSQDKLSKMDNFGATPLKSFQVTFKRLPEIPVHVLGVVYD